MMLPFDEKFGAYDFPKILSNGEMFPGRDMLILLNPAGC